MRLQNHITEQNRLFIKFLRPMTTILFFMTLHRWLMANSAELSLRHSLSIIQQFWVYWTGLRFDLLILGFFLLPPLLLGFLIRSSRKKVLVFQAYLSFFWWGNLTMTFFDLAYFSLYQKHMNAAEWAVSGLMDLVLLWFIHPLATSKVLTLAVFLMSGIIGLLELRKAARRFNSGRVTTPFDFVKKQAIVSFLLLVLVVFCARGSFGQHHLRREDSFKTHSKEWNELALNALWSFSKDDR